MVRFTSFMYSRYIVDRVQEDKRQEMSQIHQNINNLLFSIQHFADRLGEIPESDKEECLKSLLELIKKTKNFEENIHSIRRYDQFSKDLCEDFHFNTVIFESFDNG